MNFLIIFLTISLTKIRSYLCSRWAISFNITAVLRFCGSLTNTQQSTTQRDCPPSEHDHGLLISLRRCPPLTFWVVSNCHSTAMVPLASSEEDWKVKQHNHGCIGSAACSKHICLMVSRSEVAPEPTLIWRKWEMTSIKGQLVLCLCGHLLLQISQ